MTPAEGGVGTEVVISGKNFPVSNDDGSDIEVFVEYDAGVDSDDDDIEPDALGNFTVILEVPEDANIPSNNTVKVQFTDDEGATVLMTFTHRVSQGTLLDRFDTDKNGEIDKNEVLGAISAYLFGDEGDVTKDDVLAVISLYLFGG